MPKPSYYPNGITGEICFCLPDCRNILFKTWNGWSWSRRAERFVVSWIVTRADKHQSAWKSDPKTTIVWWTRKMKSIIHCAYRTCLLLCRPARRAWAWPSEEWNFRSVVLSCRSDTQLRISWRITLNKVLESVSQQDACAECKNVVAANSSH